MEKNLTFNFYKTTYLSLFLLFLIVGIILIIYYIFMHYPDLIKLLILIFVLIILFYGILISGYSYFNYHKISDNTISLNFIGSNNNFKFNEINSIQKIDKINRDRNYLKRYAIITMTNKNLCQINFNNLKKFRVAFLLNMKKNGIVIDVNNVDEFIKLIKEKIGAKTN